MGTEPMDEAPPVERTPSRKDRVTPRIAGYVVFLIVLAAIASVAFAWWLQAGLRFWDVRTLLPLAPWGLAFLAAFLLTQGFGFPLLWRGHRVTLTLDEAVLLTGFLLLPQPALLPILAPAAALLLSPVLGRGFLRSAFNVSHYLLATIAAWGAFLVLALTQLPPLVVALLAPLAFTVTSNLLLAGVITHLDTGGPSRVFRDRFLSLGAGASILGLAVGLLAHTLWGLHPAALLALAPLLWGAHRYSVASTRTERELAIHRRLGQAASDLAGGTDLLQAVNRILAGLGDVLPCGRATLSLRDAVGAPGGTWTRDYGDGPHKTLAPTAIPLRTPGGVAVGEMLLHPRADDPRALRNEEEALLKFTASRVVAILESTRALHAATESRDRAFRYLSSIEDAVLLVTPAGTIQYLNPAAQRLFHLTLEDAPRTNVKRLFEHPRLCPSLTGALPSPTLVESQACDATGSRRFVVEAHAAPVLERGQAHGIIVVARDITERKRLDNEVGRQRDLIARQEKLSALGAMVASVAHEINNPLTYMKGAIQIANEDLADLRGRRPDPRAAQSLESIEHQLVNALEGVNRLADITRSLKNAARNGKGVRRVEDVNELAKDVVEVLRMGCPRHVRLVVEPAEGYLPASVNNAEIHQVLMNLVKNASEAIGDRPGRVVLRTRATPEAILIEVEDNGPGIPEHVLKNLFTPFFTTKDKGTGLGLSISQEIVRAHGGELRVTTAAGKGTRFTMILPHPERG